MFAHSNSKMQQQRACWRAVCSADKESHSVGEQKEIRVSKWSRSDAGRVPHWRTDHRKAAGTIACCPCGRKSQISMYSRTYRATANIRGDWLAHGWQVDGHDAMQTVEHQCAQFIVLDTLMTCCWIVAFYMGIRGFKRAQVWSAIIIYQKFAKLS